MDDYLIRKRIAIIKKVTIYVIIILTLKALLFFVILTLLQPNDLNTDIKQTLACFKN